jgi:membrane dipeptidase
MTKENQVLAAEIIASSVACDMVFIYEPGDNNDESLFPRWKTSGFDFVSVHPAGDRHNTTEAIKLLAKARANILKAGDGRYILVDTVADIHRAKAEGKLAVSFHLEGMCPLERSLELVDVFYKLGVKFSHLVFNVASEVGSGCTDEVDVGLTRFGISVVREMNRVGMIVDGAHASTKSMLDMAANTSQPMLFSHAACDAIYPHMRNITDEQIKACAGTGGLIGITSAGYYLGGDPTPEIYFRHLDHVVQKVGAEHVAIGLDYFEKVDVVAAHFAANPSDWPGYAEGKWSPVAFMPPERLKDVVGLMLNAGYARSAIEGILGQNFVNLCSKVWK